MQHHNRSNTKAVAIWLLLLLFVAPLVAADLGGGQWDAARADDHDGGDDGDDDSDDDDSDDDNSSSSSSSEGGDRGYQARARRDRVASGGRRAAPASAPRPGFAPEIVVSDLSAADLAVLTAEGFSLIERRTITTLAVTLDRLATPNGVPLATARDRVRQLTSGTDADLNHFYRSSQAPVPVAAPDAASMVVPEAAPCTHENCTAWQMIGWTAVKAGTESCPVAATIGLIDTGINPDHEILSGAGLTVLPRPESGVPSTAVHGTAVASLLIGDSTSRVQGLLPGADVLAVDVFSRVAGDERADVAALVEGLDLLAAQQVRLYNLSLSGPPNSVLSRMIDRLTDTAGLDAVVVAAAGNGGPAAQPAWPGAHPNVIAVTALDARGRVYGQAQRGGHLGLAAPGVNLLAATSVKGARAKSGTSFAVPFVTAAAALLLSRPGRMSGADVRANLFASARDLGAPGRDPVFGYGLLSASALCP